MHNLSLVEDVLVKTRGVVYPSEENVFDNFSNYITKELKYQPMADFVSLILDADPGNGFSRLLKNPHTRNIDVKYLNDDGTVAEPLRNDPKYLQVIDVFADSLKDSFQLRHLFYPTVDEDTNGDGLRVRTTTTLKINESNNYLFFRVKRAHATELSPNPLPALVSIDATLKIDNCTYSLLAFIIRPSSVHYTMAMKVDSDWWLHNDQYVTKITDGIKQFESTATFLLYKRV